MVAEEGGHATDENHGTGGRDMNDSQIEASRQTSEFKTDRSPD